MSCADSSNGKPADTAVAARTAKKAEPKPNAVPQVASAMAVADHSTDQQPADMEIEAGEVDVQKGNMLSPDAPEFKPGKDASASPATGAGAAAAAAAASSKRKDAEKATSAQVENPCEGSLDSSCVWGSTREQEAWVYLCMCQEASVSHKILQGCYMSLLISAEISSVAGTRPRAEENI